MNYKKALEQILKIVENDFCADMSFKTLPQAPKYTQKEAKEMADRLGRVYSIAHCLYCKACRKQSGL
jgi:hypothetical protein